MAKKTYYLMCELKNFGGKVLEFQARREGVFVLIMSERIWKWHSGWPSGFHLDFYFFLLTLNNNFQGNYKEPRHIQDFRKHLSWSTLQLYFMIFSCYVSNCCRACSLVVSNVSARKPKVPGSSPAASYVQSVALCSNRPANV